MNAIQIISKCAASGVHLEAGRVYAVPAEVTEHDAATLRDDPIARANIAQRATDLCSLFSL